MAHVEAGVSWSRLQQCQPVHSAQLSSFKPKPWGAPLELNLIHLGPLHSQYVVLACTVAQL